VATILVVNDDDALLEGLSALLKRHLTGVIVKTSTDPSASLQQLGRERYDMAIADIKMPGMDGLTFVRSAKDVCPGTPVILLTGHGDTKLEQEALEAGAWAFATKPLERDGFLRLVRKALGHQST
jgi:DNA-binding NtrC family response regulator